MKDLRIHSRCYDLLDWLLPKTKHFPKLYRYTLTERLMNRVLDLHECLIKAQTSRAAKRLQYLQQADQLVVLINQYLRLIHHWHWLTDGQYQHVSEILAEIGRLLGGWIKQTMSSIK